MTISAVITAVGSVFTFLVTSIPQIAQVIVSEPLYQLGLGMLVAGFVIGGASRLINIR